MSEARHCPSCGAELAVDSPMGLCVPCLLGPVVNPDPARFGDYELLDAGKEGGMGKVYRARQISLDRIVALKMIRGGELATQAQVQRFQAEAHAAASLDHPNIVPIYEVGEHDGRDYFAMKWLAGGSLADALRAQAAGKRARELRDAAQFMTRVARAVHHAHQRGIIHRDLKPSNILLDAHGEPQVSDFGLAKRLDSQGALTLSDQALGTPSYMAPEQAAGKARDVTTAADIYSLGAILYELLTGQPPFAADTPAATMQKVLSEEPKRPSSVIPKLPRDLETICLKCLEKDPPLRYRSAEAVAEELDRWLRGEPLLARPSGVWSRSRKWARRNPAVATLSVAILITACVGLGVVLWELRKARLALERSEIMTEALKEFLPVVRPGLSPPEQEGIIQDMADQFKSTFARSPALLNYLLGSIDYGRGDYPRAETEFRTAVGLYETGHGLTQADLASALNSLAVMLHKQMKLREAEPFYRRAVELMTRIYGPDGPNLDVPRANYAFLLRRVGKLSQSETYYRQAYEIEQKRHGNLSTNAAIKAEDLIVVLLEQRKATEAEPLAHQTLTVFEQLWPESWHYPNAQSLLGGCLSQQKRFDQAEKLLILGYDGLSARCSTNSALQIRFTAEAIQRLMDHFTAVGALAKADDWKQKLAELNKDKNAMMNSRPQRKPEAEPKKREQ